MARTIVVSGGGTGIGRAIAHRFAAQGEHVLILGRREGVLREAAEAIPGDVEPYTVDLTQPDEVQRLADERFSAAGVDVLVNAAGGTGPSADDSLGGLAAAWEETMRSNVLTALLLTTALRDRLAKPGGRVILFSSIAAMRGGGVGYGPAKAALHGLAFTLAAQLGPDGITVNVVAPGFVEHTEFFGDSMTPTRRQSLVDATLVGRAGEPDDIAAAVDYLASPGARHVTGQILQVNGGALLGR